MTIDAPPPKKNASTAVVGSEDPGLSRSLQLVGKFPSIDLFDKAFKGRRPANRLFWMIRWYIVPFFPLKSRRASGFLAQKKPYFWERVNIAWKKHRFHQVFLKIHKSIGWTFVPNEFADFCIICFHHFITRFTQQLHVLPVASSCDKRYSFQLHVQSGRQWKGRVWGMEAQIPETWNIHLKMVLSIGWFRLI